MDPNHTCPNCGFRSFDAWTAQLDRLRGAGWSDESIGRFADWMVEAAIEFREDVHAIPLTDPPHGD